MIISIQTDLLATHAEAQDDEEQEDAVIEFPLLWSILQSI